MAKLLISLTSAKDNPEKATLAFIVANASLAAGAETVVWLSTEGVRLAGNGYGDDIDVPGLKPFKPQLDTFFANGGKLWICPLCFNQRSLDKEAVLTGATMAGAPAVVEFLAQGAASLTY
jgi:uncharacterized protein